MRKLLETIKIKNGEACNLAFHQQRCDDSLKKCGVNIKYNLAQMIQPPKKGVFRCRIIYDDINANINYCPYKKTAVLALKLIHTNIDYPLKFADRSGLDKLFRQKGKADDILIVKNGMLSDTTRANIALFDGDRWFTPASPLLFGTTRQRLLEQKLITAQKLHVNDLGNFTKIAVMNALVGFHIVKNGIII